MVMPLEIVNLSPITIKFLYPRVTMLVIELLVFFICSSGITKYQTNLGTHPRECHDLNKQTWLDPQMQARCKEGPEFTPNGPSVSALIKNEFWVVGKNSNPHCLKISLVQIQKIESKPKCSLYFWIRNGRWFKNDTLSVWCEYCYRWIWDHLLILIFLNNSVEQNKRQSHLSLL